jgi:hypothetical protein
MNLRRRRPDFIDTSTAEAGTLQLELRDLSRSSGIAIYEVFVKILPLRSCWLDLELFSYYLVQCSIAVRLKLKRIKSTFNWNMSVERVLSGCVCVCAAVMCKLMCGTMSVLNKADEWRAMIFYGSFVFLPRGQHSPCNSVNHSSTCVLQ